MRVEAVAGEGLVEVRDGILAVYAGPPGPEVEQARELVAAGGGALLRRLAGFLAQVEQAPSLAVLVATEVGWDALVVGSLTLVVEREGSRQSVSASDSPTWHDQRIHSGFELVAVLPDGEEPGPDDPRLDLRGGAVRGGGVILRAGGPLSEVRVDEPPANAPAAAVEASPTTPAGAPSEVAPAVEEQPTTLVPAFPPPPYAPPETTAVAEPASVAEPAADPADGLGDLQLPTGDVEVLDLTSALTEASTALPRSDRPEEDEPARPGGEEPETVEGILCELDHFNHPQALYCAACGRSTVNRTRVLVRRPRPSLGVLVLDEGTTFTLDAGYVVGREPEQADQVRADALRPLRLVDPQRTMSRAHAELRLEGWDVIVADRRSANGTFVQMPGSSQWARLPAGGSQVLPPGGRLGLAGRVLSYDSHHQIRR